MKRILAAAAASVSIAGSAQAATLTVELWDILAGPSTCCAANPTPEAQMGARAAAGSDTILNNLANPLTTADYLPDVDAIIDDEDPQLTFALDSSLLEDGFFANGITGLAGGGQTINDFLGFDIDGAGTGIGDNSILGTILRITGFVSVTAGDVFEVYSDDGYRIEIGDGPEIVSNTVGAPLQAPTTRTHTYGGTSGIQAFTMVWFENQRTQAALEVDDLEFVDVVPLPAGMTLMLAGLAAFGVAGRMRRRA